MDCLPKDLEDIIYKYTHQLHYVKVMQELYEVFNPRYTPEELMEIILEETAWNNQ